MIKLKTLTESITMLQLLQYDYNSQITMILLIINIGYITLKDFDYVKIKKVNPLSCLW